MNTRILFAIILFTTAAHADSIFLVPFSIETYSPVTPENIETQFVHANKDVSEQKMSQLNEALVLTSKGAKFDPALVRLEVITGGKKVYVDKNGVVKNGKSIGQGDLKKIESAALRALCP